ncbi:hypothetical protein TcWFU_010208 [Taenia crassiceps]|uniref:Uncharacterized protein n=1 Tax=Taenia crassiceps TaxID=6207 RepID=A0ABR4Q8T5_9CEST
MADEAVVVAGECSPLAPLAKSNLFTDFTFLDLVVLQVQLHVHMEMGMKGSGCALTLYKSIAAQQCGRGGGGDRELTNRLDQSEGVEALDNEPIREARLEGFNAVSRERRGGVNFDLAFEANLEKGSVTTSATSFVPFRRETTAFFGMRTPLSTATNAASGRCFPPQGRKMARRCDRAHYY